ncbi:hypothetical protein, partial [Sphingomonas sp. LaA6.9]|uniref:hypothetical protein n=1 Tax=Sphingomonas sp. LaA6.9 TaxID=2919914 RepID=UPI001F501F0B
GARLHSHIRSAFNAFPSKGNHHCHPTPFFIACLETAVFARGATTTAPALNSPQPTKRYCIGLSSDRVADDGATSSTGAQR